MADAHDGPKALPVRGVYLYLKALEAATAADGTNALESFLTECDQRQLSLGVSPALYEIGHKHFGDLVSANAVGSDCPACPNPPGL
jgi:hypothetical protein